MFILYGLREVNLTTTPMEEICPECNSENSLQLIINQSYFHLFWIPLFPTTKEASVECSLCSWQSKVSDAPVEIKQNYELVKHNFSAARYLFSGSVIAILLIVFFVFRGMEKNKLKDEYVSEPMPGDIYEIVTDINEYSLCKVVEVTNDSVYIIFNDYYTDNKSGLSELHKDEYYDSVAYGFTRIEIINRNKDGYILSVERTGAFTGNYTFYKDTLMADPINEYPNNEDLIIDTLPGNKADKASPAERK